MLDAMTTTSTTRPAASLSSRFEIPAAFKASTAELEKLHKKYLRIRAEVSGLDLAQFGLKQQSEAGDYELDDDEDYLDVLDQLSPDTLELLDHLLEEEEDPEASIVSVPGLTTDALAFVDGVIAALPNAVSNIVVGQDADGDGVDDDDPQPPVALLEEVELAADTVNSVGSLVTSALTSSVPSVSEINTMTSVYTRFKDKWTKWKKSDYYGDMLYAMDALREYLDNLDWLQGLAIILFLEARASYDPYFRLSFPKILQKSKWFLYVCQIFTKFFFSTCLLRVSGLRKCSS